MSNRNYVRSAMALALTERLPKSMREAVYETQGFKETFHLTSDAIVGFDTEGITFQRSDLFASIKNAFGGAKADVADLAGSSWQVEIIRDKESASVVITRGEKRFLVTHLALLSPDRETRLSAFRRRVAELDLPEADARRWEALLDSRVPDDEEIGDIQEDLRQTPLFVSDSIRNSLAGPTIHLNRLVPNAPKYYERLIGRAEATQDVASYVQNVLTPIMEGLVDRGGEWGYQLALLACSHSSISLALSRIETGDAALPKVLEWASTKADAMSRATCLEVGLRRIAAHPAIRAPLNTLIDCLVKNEPVAKVDQFKLLASVFVAVYGEMSMRRMFASKPPFWRRLAALAHAGLVSRQIISNGRDATDVLRWLMASRVDEFVLQCSVDSRLEPRWFADLATPDQFKQEFLGRAWATATSEVAVVTEQGWAQALLGEGDGSLRSHIRLERAFLPGPLEGALPGSQQVMPTELLASLQTDWRVASIDPTAFFRAMNALLMYQPVNELADLMSTAIARAEYQVPTTSEASVDAVLFAAASVSAITRSHPLADTILISIRRYRRLYPADLSVRDAFRVGILACSSREQLAEWTKCVGVVLNDLAFEKVLASEDASFLIDSTAYLCHLVPELWATCGRAEAALRAVLSR